MFIWILTWLLNSSLVSAKTPCERLVLNFETYKGFEIIAKSSPLRDARVVVIGTRHPRFLDFPQLEDYVAARSRMDVINEFAKPGDVYLVEGIPYYDFPTAENIQIRGLRAGVDSEGWENPTLYSITGELVDQLQRLAEEAKREPSERNLLRLHIFDRVFHELGVRDRNIALTHAIRETLRALPKTAKVYVAAGTLHALDLNLPTLLSQVDAPYAILAPRGQYAIEQEHEDAVLQSLSALGFDWSSDREQETAGILGRHREQWRETVRYLR